MSAESPAACRVGAGGGSVNGGLLRQARGDDIAAIQRVRAGVRENRWVSRRIGDDACAYCGKVPGTRMLRSTSTRRVRPQKAIVRSSSLWMISSALLTPASPMAARP